MKRHGNVPEKANRVLNILLIALLLIGVRVWHLTVVQHEDRLKEASRPKQKTLRTPPFRGTIVDRFGIPMAQNRVHYTLSIHYSDIRSIPRSKRSAYIKELSTLIGEELHMDPDRVEDLMHSKAALHHHLPYVVKEDLPEKTYYRLKILERKWPGLLVQALPKRDYPLGKVGAEIIGYMGAINWNEYQAVMQQVMELEVTITQFELGEPVLFPPNIESIHHAKEVLSQLVDKAYSIRDRVGKMGVEKTFEHHLRGKHGISHFLADAKGNFLQELPGGASPIPGEKVTLALSAELQEFCEQLLATNETFRKPRITSLKTRKTLLSDTAPFIMGGAIVALDPNNGDVLALASYPRFNPNDFIQSGSFEEKQEKMEHIFEWFELNERIEKLWDQTQALTRERFDTTHEKWLEETHPLTWEKYLELILEEASPIHLALKKIQSVEEAVKVQNHIEHLLALSGQQKLVPLLNLLNPDLYTSHPLPILTRESLQEAFIMHASEMKKRMDAIRPFFAGLSSNQECALFIDLLRVATTNTYSEAIFPYLKSVTLNVYREENGAVNRLFLTLKKLSKELYHYTVFKKWRENHQKTFLKECRLGEKERGQKYATPYLDLLDQKERQMFQEFWECNQLDLFLALTQKRECTAPFKNELFIMHDELSLGAHQNLPWREDFFILKNRLQKLPERFHQEYIENFRTYAELSRPLLSTYKGVRYHNGTQSEQELAAAFYPRYGYGYARSWAFRQATPQGSIFKLVTAYAALLQNHEILKKMSITESYYKRGKTSYIGYDQNGDPLPQFLDGGRIPTTVDPHLGKIDLIKAIEVSSNPFFCYIAKTILNEPNDLSDAARAFGFGEATGIALPGEYRGRVPFDLNDNTNALYAMSIGQHSLAVTPLQTAVMISVLANGGSLLTPKLLLKEGTQIKRKLPFSKEVQNTILKGMRLGVKRSYDKMIFALSDHFQDHPEAIADFIAIGPDIYGKTGTAESIETLAIDQGNLYNHIWFGGISYKENQPDLVVVVFLRYGGWGKDTLPLAAQVVAKWRSIQKSKDSI